MEEVSNIMQRAQSMSDFVEAGPSGSQVVQRSQEADDLAATQLKVELMRVRHQRQLGDLQSHQKAELQIVEREQMQAFAKQIEKVLLIH